MHPHTHVCQTHFTCVLTAVTRKKNAGQIYFPLRDLFTHRTSGASASELVLLTIIVYLFFTSRALRP